MKAKTLFAGLLAVLFLFGVAGAIEYPKQIGHVNDFAKLLPVDVARKLETELRTYKEQTSIEIAVVTVKSLEGLSLEDYTIGLAREWGVGEKKKDNGVVLLVAPNERKVRIEVGYGLEPDLTDSQAGRVIRDIITPLFKEWRMSDGVVAGVAGILQQLSDTPYATRAEERAAAAEKKRQEDERSRQAFLTFLAVAASIIAFVVIVGFVVFRIKKYREWKGKMIAFHYQNHFWLKELADKIIEADAEYYKSVELLKILKRENPKEIWEELEKKVSLVPEAVAALRARQINALADYDNGWKFAEEARGVISKLHNDAIGYASVYEEVLAKKDELLRARERSDGLRVELPEKFIKARLLLDHLDVSKSTHEKLKDAERKFDAAEAMLKLSTPMLNWLSVYAFLLNASALMTEAKNVAESDKREAEKARHEGPKLLRELPESIKRAESAVSDSNVSSPTKQKVEEAKTKYNNAKSLVRESPMDWLSAFALLSAAALLLADAIKAAESDKDKAERKRRRKRDDNYYHSSSSSSGRSSGSGGGGGGGFGGFGGGGFGGGGASGSW